MSAELRWIAGHVWVVDLQCGLEEFWNEDAVGAGMRADDHNDARHARSEEVSEFRSSDRI